MPELSISATPLQPLMGFGAALTESSAYNFLQLKARNTSAYAELLLQLFAPPPQGIAMSFMRVPITSCDLSLPTPGWSFDDTPDDVTLSHFNTSHAMVYQLPVLQDIMKLADSYGLKINLVGTPWSAPSWIKSPEGAWNNGTVLDEWYSWYVNYLVNVVDTFQSLGIPLYALSLQNEPTQAWGTYPSTIFSALNESSLANILRPALRAKGFSTLVVAWDGDYDNLNYPQEVLQRVGGDGQSVDGVAFHCYSAPGPTAQTAFHQQYPGTLLFMTECSGFFDRETSTTDFLNNWLNFLPSLYFANLVNWGSSAHHWALSLDLDYGPQTGGGCTDCASVVTVDAANSSRPYVVQFSSEYYMIGHFGSFIPPASNLLQTTASASVANSGMYALAAVTPDQSVVVQLLNTGSSAPVTVLVRDQRAQSCYLATVQPQSLSTFKYAGSAYSGAGGGLSSGVTAAVVISVLVGVAALVGAAFLLCRRRNASNAERYSGQQDDAPSIALSSGARSE